MAVDIDKLYSDKFFSGRSKYNWRAEIVCSAVVEAMRINHDLTVTSACDVGCAIGDLVQGYLDLGLDAWGIEGAKAAAPYLVCPKERVAFHDLRKPLPPDGVAWRSPQEASVSRWPRSDVVTCFEVAEHLEPEYADQFCDTLCRLSDHLVISACPPNPNGKPPTKYHLNEQPRDYWYKLFADRGYDQDQETERLLTTMWYPWRHKYGIAAYWQNLLCLQPR